MDTTVVVSCLLIIAARVTDVALGTLRTVFVVQGRSAASWALGFFEILIWVFAVSRVIANLDQPAYAVSYAFGYATGNYVGIVMERWLALGDQVVRVFTHKGPKIAAQLRKEGFRVTAFPATGRDGPLEMLFIEIPRKKTQDIVLFSRKTDPTCFYIIDDIRQASTATLGLHQPTGWRAVLKKK